MTYILLGSGELDYTFFDRTATVCQLKFGVRRIRPDAEGEGGQIMGCCYRRAGFKPQPGDLEDRDEVVQKWRR